MQNFTLKRFLVYFTSVCKIAKVPTVLIALYSSKYTCGSAYKRPAYNFSNIPVEEENSKKSTISMQISEWHYCILGNGAL